MKLMALTLLAASIPGMALAQRRPDVTAMTCGGATALIARAGALVVGTGGQTYDRIVVHRGFCTPSETIEPVFVPTINNPACMIGYRCIEMESQFDRN